MSVGMVLLTAAAILVFFGVAQRVLDKMYLSDRAALLLIALMFFGTLIPNLKLGTVEVEHRRGADPGGRMRLPADPGGHVEGAASGHRGRARHRWGRLCRFGLSAAG